MLVLCALPVPSSAPSAALVTLPALAARMRDPGGPEIRIAPELRNETLFVSLQAETPARLRDLVARAVRAEWIPAGRDLRLERGNALRKRLAIEEGEENARAFGAAWTDRAREPSAYGDDLRAGVQRYSRRSEEIETSGRATTPAQDLELGGLERAVLPGERLLSRLMVRMDPRALTLGADRVLRFSTAPGRWIAPFGVETQDLLRRYHEERDAFVTAADGVLETAAADPTLADRLALTAREDVGGLSIDLSIARRMDRTVEPVDPNAPAPPVVPGMPPLPVSKEVVPVDQIEMVPIGRSFLASVEAEDSRWPGADAWPATRVAPERNERMGRNADPLELVAGPFVRAAAQAAGGEIVLDLPDTIARTAAGRWSLGTDLREIAAGLRPHLRFSLVDGVLVGSPRRPLRAAAERMPRTVVPRYLGMLARGEDLTFREAGEYFAVGRAPELTGMEWALAQRSGLRGEFAFPLVQGRDAMRLLATMPEALLPRAEGRTGVGLDDLSPEGRLAVYEWMYLNDRTDYAPLYPDGLPPETRLMLRGFPEGQQLSAGVVYSPEAIGRLVELRRRNGDTGVVDGVDLETTKFTPFRRRSLHATIGNLFTADSPWRFDLLSSVNEDGVRGTPARWDALPAPILARIRTAAERFRRSEPGR